jgi:3-oxoacyl-[acyl-carrier protein] reductase
MYAPGSARPASCRRWLIASHCRPRARVAAAAYGAAKAGLASLARSVAAEYSRDGIRMNVVSCGPIAIPVAQAAGVNDALDWILMRRSGSVDEAARATLFLASALSSFSTGQSLVVDGATAIGPFPTLRCS